MNKNKRNMVIAIIGSVAILIIGGIMSIQISKNHQVNQLIIDKCFESFDKEESVVIKKDGFWSPVVCEKE